MPTIEHSHFGPLDSSGLTDTDVIWERQGSLGDDRFDIWLWAEPGGHLNPGLLDAFAQRLNDLQALDVTARAALRATLLNDRSFIDFYADELSGHETVLRLTQAAKGQPIDAEAFVAAMHLCGLGLWLGEGDDPIVMDYMLDPETDQILAVKMSPDGAVLSVDWES